MISKKTPSIVIVFFLFGMGIFYAFTSHSSKAYTVIDQPQWKNLKVLPQNISKDSLDGLMKGYTVALGVKCSFCHATSKDNPQKLDFADDSKIEKIIARGMIEMTDDINSKYFLPHKPDPKPTQTYDVSCITCHRGNMNPYEYLQNVGKAIHVPEAAKK